MKHLVYILFILNCAICNGQNILLNSDFSCTNYGWQTSGSFHYDSRFQACNSCEGYAYFSNSNGTTSNNLFGELYQSVYFPANVTSATFAFSYSIHTSEPNIAANDLLNVSIYVGNTEVWRVIDISNKFATTYPGGPANYQSFEVPVPQNLIPQMANSGVSVVFRASNDGNNPTVFRLDDVKLNITTGPVGIRTGCVTWTNGNLPPGEVINAAENLCNQRFISSTIDVQLLQRFNVVEASTATLDALYQGNAPSSLPSDNVPTFFGDIDKLPFNNYQAIKAMCYLESGDGRSCFNREHTFIFPNTQMAKGNILRMLFEAWNIAPDMQGYDVFNHSQSSFSNVIYNDDYNYGYFKRAFQDNLLGSYVFNGAFLDNNTVKPGEFYLVVLNNIVNRYGRRNVATTEYYNPNNIQLTNASVPRDITRGVFKSYEQSGFSIPSGGLGLDFIYSYHSDLVDIPSLGYSNYFSPYITLIEQFTKERIFPLGFGWTHTYNIYAQSVLDAEGKDKYIVIHWGDGSITVYNVPEVRFESAGVYDKFVVTGNFGGHITSFNIISKQQVTTRFNISSNSDLVNPSFFQATLIQNQNNQSINLVYESSNCTGGITNCFGSSTERLVRVIDNFSNRILSFKYAPGSDLLSSVSDDIGRSMTFTVNRVKLNLDAVTNARKYTTYYNYGRSDAENHLLLTITRPNGNTINNTYANRKLKQTQTPEYLTKVEFNPSYLNAAISTQSEITTIPSAGTQYSIKYTQSSFGTVSTITSAGSNISLTYGDNQNPTLPTIVVDNKTNIRQNFRYDNIGNILQSDYSGGGLTQTNRFTYDQTNHLLTHTWPNNTVTTYTYDNYGNKTKETTSNYNLDYGYFPNGLLAVKLMPIR
jgi:YD repeat-containing protein